MLGASQRISMAEILFVPRLRIARSSLVSYLAERPGECRIALPYPKELEGYATGYARGKLGWKRLLGGVAGILGPYAQPWLKIEEPLLRGLRLVADRRDYFGLFFYRSADAILRSAEAQLELVRLVLRSAIREEVDVDEWRELIAKIGRSERGELYRQLEDLLEDGYSLVTESREVAGGLSRRRGVPVREVLRGYIRTPIEELWRSAEVDEKAVEAFIRYIRDYLVTSRSLDEAYFRWIVDNHPSAMLSEFARKILKELKTWPT